MQQTERREGDVMNPNLADLQVRFERVAVAAGATRGIDEAFASLVRRYSEPTRHYHTLTHVEACLVWLDWHAGVAERLEEVALALWFHDAVYDPQAHDNERRSAELATSELAALGLPSATIARIAGYVQATQAHAGTGDAALVIDLDLTILAASAVEFQRFEQQIRREYAHVPDEAFRLGRRLVLEGFLARRHIYQTPGLRGALEPRARANLERTISQLR